MFINIASSMITPLYDAFLLFLSLHCVNGVQSALQAPKALASIYSIGSLYMHVLTRDQRVQEWLLWVSPGESPASKTRVPVLSALVPDLRHSDNCRASHVATVTI